MSAARRTRLLAWLLVILVLCGAGVVLVDHYARRAVEQRMAAALAPRLGHRPDVDVEDTSVLVALARDRWAAIRVRTHMARVPVRGSSLPATVDLRVSGVSGLLRGPVVRADRAAGTVALDWASVSRQAGMPLSATVAGDLTATTTVTALGERLPVVVTGRPVVDVQAQRLGFAQATATVDGVAVPDDVLRGILTRLQDRLTLPRSPGIRVVSVETTREGPRLTIRGDALSLSR